MLVDIALEELPERWEGLASFDLLIINELEPLFMGVWDNGESFTENTEWLVWYKCQS